MGPCVNLSYEKLRSMKHCLSFQTAEVFKEGNKGISKYANKTPLEFVSPSASVWRV
jgi:hypothetical protein